MQKTVFIYALNCPTTGRTRYIGKAANPRKRFSAHLKANRNESSHRACWIRSLLIKGLKPSLEILDEVPEEHWQQWEVAYIEFFREQEGALVNNTFGGDGGPVMLGKEHPFFGKKFSLEYRKKLSISHLGIQAGNKHGMFGKKQSSEARAKMRTAKKVVSQQYWAGRKPSNNKSGFVGVRWHKIAKKWLAALSVNGKVIYLGLYRAVEDAVFVRNLAVQKYCI